MGRSEGTLYDAGNNRALERYSDRRIARRGNLNNPANAGEHGDQAQLVTPRQGARSKKSRNLASYPAGYRIVIFRNVSLAHGMNRDSKSSTLNAFVPAWAHEPHSSPAQPGRASHKTVLSSECGSPTQAFFRVGEVATILKVSTKTIRRLLARGDLKAAHIGRSVRIHSSELENLIAGSRASAGVSGGGGDDA